MPNRIFFTLITAITISVRITASDVDTIPDTPHRQLQWRLGTELSPALVLATNDYLNGYNTECKNIRSSMTGALRADFSFSPQSTEGRLYPGLYQGIGADIRSFAAGRLIGTPVSVYVYQGAPLTNFNKRMWLGYEWKFGAAFGWKHRDVEPGDGHRPVSTSVTAHMNAGVKLHYALSPRWQLSAGMEATHFSNGNTSLPNAGINSIGATIGLTRIITPLPATDNSTETAQGNTGTPRKWFCDITVYGARRKRVVAIGDDIQLCPGSFAVAGVQVAPMRRLNHIIAVGGTIGIQYDESYGLGSYWVDGTYGDDIKFYRPPLGRQLSTGLSANAELTMPIFAVNAGFGYDIISPEDEKRFYQTLTLKTFIMRNIYINVGYRLGNFSVPQNLMLGAGVRL